MMTEPHWKRSIGPRKRYSQNIDNMSKVLSEIGKSNAQIRQTILGICGTGKYSVIKDLINHPNLWEKETTELIHFDSLMNEGIDVALLYKRQPFLSNILSKSYELMLTNRG